MSADALWERIRAASMLLTRPYNGLGRVRAGTEREVRPKLRRDEPAVEKDGYTEEALPWLDAVYRFALRLTRGESDRADDLVQETFLRAYRSWHTFRRGTDARAWLFAICRNAFLHQQEGLQRRRERLAADVDTAMETTVGQPVFEQRAADPETDFFDQLIDDEVVRAIDNLPDEFRDVLVLSDLGDLKYKEIAEVLGIPIGTAKSRLFRARRILQHRLSDYAAGAGYGQERDR